MGKRSLGSCDESQSKRLKNDQIFDLTSMVANNHYLECLLQGATPSTIWTMHNVCKEWRTRLATRTKLIFQCCVEWTQQTPSNRHHLGKLFMIFNLHDAGYLTEKEYESLLHRLRFSQQQLGSMQCTKILVKKWSTVSPRPIIFPGAHFLQPLCSKTHRGDAGPFAHLAFDSLMSHGLCGKLLRWFLHQYLLFPNINVRRLITENALISAQTPGHILHYCLSWATKKKVTSFRDLTKLPDVSGEDFFYLRKLNSTYTMDKKHFVLTLFKSACRIPDKSEKEPAVRKYLIKVLANTLDRELVTNALEYLATEYGKNFTDETLDSLFSLDFLPTTFKTSSSQILRILLKRRPLSSSAIRSFWHHIDNYHSQWPKRNPFKKLPKIAKHVVEEDILLALMHDMNSLDKKTRKIYGNLFNRLTYHYPHEKLRESIEILVTRCAKGYEQEMLGHIYYPREPPAEFFDWPVDTFNESKGVIKYNFLVEKFKEKQEISEEVW